MIVTSDLHLVDAPNEGYRWAIFDKLRQAAIERDDNELYILGDLTDRKDRHSAALVNTICDVFTALVQENIFVTCLLGNHDKPLNGPPYWSMLNHMEGVQFITEPRRIGDRWLLPYSDDPAPDWYGLDLDRVKVVFMHQPVSGARTNNGFVLERSNVPSFPPDIRVYSGDIHTPQTIGNVTYVGAPHPIKFGDDYPCRFLYLSKDYKIEYEYPLHPPAKHVFEIGSLDDLQYLRVRHGDQVRIKVRVPQAEIDQWPRLRRAVLGWMEAQGAKVASISAEVQAARAQKADAPDGIMTKAPDDVIQAFADANKLDKELRRTGIELWQAFHADR